MALQSINPVNEEPIEAYSEMSAGTVTGILDDSYAAFEKWRRTSFKERGRHLHNVANVLDANKRQYAELITREMGKPIAQAVSEIDKCAWGCRYFADHAEELLAPVQVATDASKSFVTFQPVGISLAIMPWNYPFWQVFRCAFQSLMAGNTVALKHASNVTGSALAIEECIREAGLPENVFRTLVIENESLTPVIEHRGVRVITLTGSPRAGVSVAKQAAEVLKKCIFELGGSDAFIVLEDADLDAAAETAATSRLLACGQSCIGAKRFIVVDEVREAFTEKFVEKMSAASVGDPMNSETNVGPLARVDLRDSLHDQVKRSLDGGAQCILGGEKPDKKGAWYPATVITGVKKGIAAFEEELFGPVGSIIAANDEADAIRQANDSRYGLGAVVFTGDKARGERIAAEEIDAGCCFVNEFTKSDPRLPFGGVKDSGYGRELGAAGIQDLCNIKTVYIK